MYESPFGRRPGDTQNHGANEADRSLVGRRQRVRNAQNAQNARNSNGSMKPQDRRSPDPERYDFDAAETLKFYITVQR